MTNFCKFKAYLKLLLFSFQLYTPHNHLIKESLTKHNWEASSIKGFNVITLVESIYKLIHSVVRHVEHSNE